MPNEYNEIFGDPFVFYSTSYEFDCAMIDNEYSMGTMSTITLRSDAWCDYVAMYCMMSV
jgi:hypothetical protein